MQPYGTLELLEDNFVFLCMGQGESRCVLRSQVAEHVSCCDVDRRSYDEKKQKHVLGLHARKRLFHARGKTLLRGSRMRGTLVAHQAQSKIRFFARGVSQLLVLNSVLEGEVVSCWTGCPFCSGREASVISASTAIGQPVSLPLIPLSITDRP